MIWSARSVEFVVNECLTQTSSEEEEFNRPTDRRRYRYTEPVRHFDKLVPWRRHVVSLLVGRITLVLRAATRSVSASSQLVTSIGSSATVLVEAVAVASGGLMQAGYLRYESE